MAKEEKNKPKPCPKWLNDVAKKEWRRVAKIFAAEGKEFTDKGCRGRNSITKCNIKPYSTYRYC